MKNIKIIKLGCYILFFMGVLGVFKIDTFAASATNDTIKKGMFIESVDVSGMTALEAEDAVEEYIEELSKKEIKLIAYEDAFITITASDAGIQWENTEIIQEVLEYGSKGNVIERYKILKDMEKNPSSFKLQFSFDENLISDIIEHKCAKFSQEAIDVHLTREGGKFKVVDGQIGYVVSVEESKEAVYSFLSENITTDNTSVELVVVEDLPKGSVEELESVKDVLGSATTAYKSSSASRVANIKNGTRLINGITLYPGEEFSMFDYVLPFTSGNGYEMAGSYLNGMVVDSLGGGICQVSTTLYNALLNAELDITERYNHSMTVSYVPVSADAAIAESANKDFKFVNNTDYPIYIEGYTSDQKTITFNIYGKETRSANRKIVFESEIVETKNPTEEKIIQSTAYTVGYSLVQSAHIGYKSRLWKVVYENGVEVSRTQVNSSNYNMSPRTITVGVSTENPAAYEEIQAAIATGSIDHIRNVANAWAAQNAAIAAEAAAAAAAAQEALEDGI